jgi:hypothetical protein
MDSAKDTARAVGCPIRRSRDQRSLASPPGFSQRATSFIASQCQGIHQMPLLALERHTQRQGPPVEPKVPPRRQAKPQGLAESHQGPGARNQGSGMTPRLAPPECDKLSSQKTLRDPRARPFGRSTDFPLRSHNSLLYDCQSAHALASPTGDAAMAIRVLLAASSLAPGAGACRGLLRKPLSARQA